ncbi:DEAD/DEAH box helicase [Paenibacillus ginsengihumi]|uniref:DEAD/DEAH box helicase n=1 Tax=Paenibacillus ginsengihumi TaxID=431596 RepID=UPI000380C027|nr:DEAD/DEAH box helicase [Paenibacillus ginsengihumi]
MNRTTFAALGIRPEIERLLRQQGIAVPTPVQQQAVPALLAGKDAIVQAQTGTGKTLAFVLPILECIRTDKPHIQALIVTPTRELAIQITAEIKKLAPAVGAQALAAYGGQDVLGQIRKLQGAAHIVIGTPGRILDHLRRETMNLSRVSMLVLDEADQMLDMGFLTDEEEIVRHLPRSRQTMLFSATMPGPVRALAARDMRSPEDIRVSGRQVTLEGIRQIVVETTDRLKQRALLGMIERYRPYLAVVFCRTKIRARKLTEALQAEGLEADELHGDMTQSKREQVMKRFREAKLQLLVATDVAARGLDVEGVTHVFNYDIPHDGESYIHRIGRTGRAGNKGMAVTLVSPRDRYYLTQIEKAIGETLERKSMSEFVPEAEKEKGDWPEERLSGGKKGAGRPGKAGAMGDGGGSRPQRQRSGRAPARDVPSRRAKQAIARQPAKGRRQDGAGRGAAKPAGTRGGGRQTDAGSRGRRGRR